MPGGRSRAGRRRSVLGRAHRRSGRAVTGLAVLAAALAATLAVRVPAIPPRPAAPSIVDRESTRDWTDGLRRASPWLAVALAVVATNQLIGGVVGLIAGLVVGMFVHRRIPGHESGRQPTDAR